EQSLGDLVLFEAGNAQLAPELGQLGAGIAAPVVFIDEREHFKHGPNIAHPPRRWAGPWPGDLRAGGVRRGPCAGTGRRAGAPPHRPAPVPATRPAAGPSA